jgi:TATA-box binding protein (TBP) (component of TFIID and TFIIIB)
MKQQQGWEQQLDSLCAQLVPLKKRPALIEAAKQLPKIVNVVATANLLPPGYTLPLRTIASSVACAQYAPRMFAASILRFTGSISACTVLLFSTGSVVIVSLRSKDHARYMGQVLRSILEAACPLFAQRLRFDRCEIHNVVGNADLGYPIDLKAMSEAAPSCCKWFPELFPGLECKIWLTESYKCVCGKGGGGNAALAKLLPGAGSQRKCSCVVKLLIFKTGCLVITGARRLSDVNAVFFRIKSLLGEFKSDGIDKRFYKELGSMLTKTSTTTTTTEQRKELKPDVAVACVLSGMNPMFTATAPTGGEKNQNGVVSLPPFMQMALAGRVEVVRTLFLMDPDAAEEQDSASRTTLERLLCIPAAERTAEQSQIIEMLKEVKKQ